MLNHPIHFIDTRYSLKDNIFNKLDAHHTHVPLYINSQLMQPKRIFSKYDSYPADAPHQLKVAHFNDLLRLQKGCFFFRCA